MPKATPATPSTPTTNNKSLGISVPDSQTLSSDAKNSKKFTVSIFFYLICGIEFHVRTQV